MTIVCCSTLEAQYAMLNQVTAGTIALVDMNATRLDGEAKDLAQGSAFHQTVRILADSSYNISENSHLVIVTAGVAQKVGESRLALIERNVAIMKDVIPRVLEHSPNAAICIVSNPCDIMTAVASKIAGVKCPPGRIFGSGTCLDSSRLRSLLAKGLDMDAQSVSGYVIGEHGDSSVAVWSSVSVGGVPILQPGQEPSAILKDIHREVVESAYDVIAKKGSTNWAVGLTGAHIANAVLEDTHSIMPLSTCVRGFHGINEDVFLSVPCSVGAGGIRRVIDMPLLPCEIEGFLKSAETVWDVQRNIWDSI